MDGWMVGIMDGWWEGGRKEGEGASEQGQGARERGKDGTTEREKKEGSAGGIDEWSKELIDR